jgi:hypothetical protein
MRALSRGWWDIEYFENLVLLVPTLSGFYVTKFKIIIGMGVVS